MGKMLKHTYFFAILLFIMLPISLAAKNVANTESTTEEWEKRKGKLFPIFQIVRFPNSACSGTGSKNGTCYTSAECSAKGGVSAGTRASSYGVCCVFTGKCGQTFSQNCTYFESTGTTAGSCGLTICKCSDNICQLRLDFNTFVISGPSSDTRSVTSLLNGIPAVGSSGGGGGVIGGGGGGGGGAGSVTAQTQCLTDTFTVTNPGGQSPPTICGTNTGQHMYVDASKACNEISFQLGTTGVGTVLASRQWSIKVTQLDCNSQTLAPPGCTQYYYGTSATGSVQTFNYDGGKQLANQDQNICVRQEKGNCKICWSADAVTDVQVSFATINSGPAQKSQSHCCAYGSDGKYSSGADCLTIPGALTTAMSKASKKGLDRICGSGKGLLAWNSAHTAFVAGTVCSLTTPFNLRFLSDGYEFVISMETKKTQQGFKLTYFQSGTGCPTTTTG